RELQRQNAHADEVRAVDALEALGDDRLDAKQARSFRRPVSGRTGAVLLAAKDYERGAVCLVVLRGIVDKGLRGIRLGEVAGVAAFHAVEQLVLQTDIREGSTNHDLVIASTRPV